MTKTKGCKSRQEILDQARKYLNEEGIGLTIAEISKKLGTTQGKITYYFPTKEQMFMALVEEFESKRMQYVLSYETENRGFDGAFPRISGVMDLQYNYRCVHRFLISASQYKAEHYNIFKRLSGELREMITILTTEFVKAGSMEERVLHPDCFNILFFQLSTMFRSWVVTHELYDMDKTYEEIKPVYLKGLISCYYLFATEKGKKELMNLGVPI
jgi:AcrR family transcriptional regulator